MNAETIKFDLTAIAHRCNARNQNDHYRFVVSRDGSQLILRDIDRWIHRTPGADVVLDDPMHSLERLESADVEIRLYGMPSLVF